jgi:hypothetical protein
VGCEGIGGVGGVVRFGILMGSKISNSNHR